MLDRIVTWSLENRLTVLMLWLVVALLGGKALTTLPIDAFPDTTPVQVTVSTAAPRLSAEEIESQVTIPVEQVVAGLPGLQEVRSISKFGLSQLTAVFDDSVDLYLARQLVSERIALAELPAGVPEPALGPVATGLGEVFHYTLSSKTRSLRELTTLHDWEIRPRLRSVPGCAEVNTWGGRRKEFHVVVSPARLLKFDMTLDDIVLALRRNNLTVGGGLVSRAGESHVVRGVALATDTAQLGSIVIRAERGVPVRIADVGTVQVDHEIRRGAVTAQGQGEVVLGLAFMLPGENSHAVTTRFAERLEEIRADLPEDITLRPVYLRTELVDQVIHTVERNLLEGALLVIAVLFISLGRLRAGIIVALAIPLSMLVAAEGMLRFGIAASLMSLGAVDFGLVVDSSVVMVENCVRRLGEAAPDADHSAVVRDAALEVRGPTMFGELIIMIVYLPILTLEGVEGDLFRPMALTVLFALAGSLLISLTLMPALCSLLLRGPRQATAGSPSEPESENVLVRLVKAIYGPMLRASLRYPTALLTLAALLLGGGLGATSWLGGEFVPRLSERSIVINTVRLAGVSLDESVRYGDRIERALLEAFPDEVRDVWTRTGTPEVATDPMGLEVSDMFITLKPRENWTRARTQAELVTAMDAELAKFPAMRTIFTQPIELRMNEIVSGIRSDVGIKVFGEDLEAMKATAERVLAIIESLPGGGDGTVEQVTGRPVLRVEVDREALARYGVPAAHVLELVEAIGLIHAGEVRDGGRRFRVGVRLPDRFREDPDALREVLVTTADGRRIPLAWLASIRQEDGPATITREWQKRRLVVQCNVRGRDLESFVLAARAELDRLELPPRQHIEIGGQFEHLQRARSRLRIVVPLALGLIVFLLWLSTESIPRALAILTGAPFAALGGIVLLLLRDMPFTISAAVGFIAVSGVSMLNGLVIAAAFDERLAAGLTPSKAAEEACLIRLRAIMMTALVAALGFLPMAFNTGVGAEVQRPLATVVLGGVISDNLLTMLVLPVLLSLTGPTPAQDDATEGGET